MNANSATLELAETAGGGTSGTIATCSKKNATKRSNLVSLGATISVKMSNPCLAPGTM
ncbi:MAG: hypothetical protein P8R42_08180 [Candidatus Binatia bacterium]|nr:hypothetical protein [Candidatus Binatia bacterium]